MAASNGVRPKGPGGFKVTTFPGPEVARAYPYGIYDIGRNAGFVNVGTDHDTGAFAVASIRGWWRTEGRHIYPHAKTILITAVTAGPGKAFDKACLHRIEPGARHNDRNGFGRICGCADRPEPSRHDKDINFKLHQLGRKSGKPSGIALRASVQHRNVLSFDVTKLLQGPPNLQAAVGVESRWESGYIPDSGDFCRLLRVGAPAKRKEQSADSKDRNSSLHVFFAASLHWSL